MEFSKPKLKRKRGASIPTPLLGKEKESGGSKCSGILTGSSVLVQNKSDVTTLVREGCYGKGIFSRSLPTHVITTDTPTLGTASEKCSGGGKPQRKRAKFVRDGSVGEEGEAREEDSHPLTEALCLTGEEAFYLSAEVDRLSVYPTTSTSDCFSTEELWKQLCACHKRFPYTYSTYRHYRRKGWVVKSGLKFGVDYLLYKDGPEAYHSSYAVIVQEHLQTGVGTSDEDSNVASTDGCDLTTGNVVSPGPSSSSEGQRAEEGGEAELGLRWIDVIAHCRVCESTNKELVVSYVTVPCGCDETHILSSPDSVDQVTLQEVLVTRWLPERDR